MPYYTMLVSVLNPARAEKKPADPVIELARAVSGQGQAGAADRGASRSSRETVEQRIKDIQKALKITPDVDAKWSAVEQAMRENAVIIDKLIASTRTVPPQNMSMADELKTFQKFAQEYADGLKSLIASLEMLYAALPDAQKKIADDAFRTLGN